MTAILDRKMEYKFTSHGGNLRAKKKFISQVGNSAVKENHKK